MHGTHIVPASATDIAEHQNEIAKFIVAELRRALLVNRIPIRLAAVDAVPRADCGCAHCRRFVHSLTAIGIVWQA